MKKPVKYVCKDKICSEKNITNLRSKAIKKADKSKARDELSNTLVVFLAFAILVGFSAFIIFAVNLIPRIF